MAGRDMSPLAHRRIRGNYWRLYRSRRARAQTPELEPGVQTSGSRQRA